MVTISRPANVVRECARTASLIFLFLPLLILTVAWPAQAAVPGWSGTGSLTTAREYHTSTLLPNGKVLAAGGYGSDGTILSSAELYTPADTGAGSWTTTGAGALAAARGDHTATLLSTGNVLVAGGVGTGGYLSSTELYDPVAGSWANDGTMGTGRSRHVATLLPNGKVLVAGGINGSGSCLSSAELYTPMDWRSWAAPLNTARFYHTATLLPNGKVLVAGGSYSCSGGWLASAELYDPATGTWSPTANNLTTARDHHTATLLGNGKVLVAGGYNGSYLASAELYDPATNSWTTVGAGTLATARRNHTATLLGNGKVLIAGGFGSGSTILSSAELYDPGTGAWTTSGAGTLITGRGLHTATRLGNGKVLVAGGWGSGGLLSSVELYDTAGAWVTMGGLFAGCYDHTATLLGNGKVLVAGGEKTTCVALNNAQIYPPQGLVPYLIILDQ